MITSGLLSSLTENWATPPALFEQLDQEFQFTLDACASATNYKVANYFDKEIDSLQQDWFGTVWMNPPYGRTIGQWMKKAYESAGGGQPLFALFRLAQTQLGGGITR